MSDNSRRARLTFDKHLWSCAGRGTGPGRSRCLDDQRQSRRLRPINQSRSLLPFTDDRLNVAALNLLLLAAPKNAELYLQRGLAWGRLNDPRKAIADYTAFLKLASPSHERFAETLCRRATNYNFVQDYAAVFADMRQVLSLEGVDIGWDDQCAMLCNNAVWHYAATPPKDGFPKDALRMAQKAVALEPNRALYQNTLGVVYYRLGRYQEAIDCLEKNLIPNKDYAAFDLYFLSMSFAKLGQPTKAKEYFEKAESWRKEHKDLSAGHVKELDAFRAEAEGVVREAR